MPSPNHPHRRMSRHGHAPESPRTGREEIAEEAENVRVRARLMDRLSRFIEGRGMKQREAADFFGESQPRISHLVSRKTEKFSIDALVNMHAKTGAVVRFTVVAPGKPPE